MKTKRYNTTSSSIKTMVPMLLDLCLTNILLDYQKIDPHEVALLTDYYSDMLFEQFHRQVCYKIQKVKHRTMIIDGCLFYNGTPHREITDIINWMYKVPVWATRLGGLEASWEKYINGLQTRVPYSDMKNGLSNDYF